MSIKQPQGLTQIAFSELCGVSRQSISKAIKKGRLVNVGGLLPLDHPINARYLSQKQNEAQAAAYRKQADQAKQDGAENQDDMAAELPADDVIPVGGYMTAKEIADIELKREQKKKIQIQNALQLELLIEKDIAIFAIDTISQEIKSGFVDFGRRHSAIIAAICGAPEKEPEIKAYLEKEIAGSIEGVKNKSCEWIDKKYWR